MDFRQIEAFIQVVKLKSFSKAADAIFLTQPTISSHINSLENELEVKLIDRSRKEIIPTKAGKIFFDYANNLINIRDNAIYTLRKHSNSAEGVIELAASSVPTQYLIPQLMMDFNKKYSNVHFSVHQMDSKQVIEEVLDKNIELGLVGTREENSKLVYDFLKEDKLVLITPNNAKYKAVTTNALSFDFVRKEGFIFRESGSGTRQEFERILSKNGLKPDDIKIAALLNSTEAVKQSVSLGLGVSIVSLISVLDYVKFGQIKAFDIEGIEMTRGFYSVYHKNRPLSPLNSAFLDFIKGYYSSK